MTSSLSAWCHIMIYNILLLVKFSSHQEGQRFTFFSVRYPCLLLVLLQYCNQSTSPSSEQLQVWQFSLLQVSPITARLHRSLQVFKLMLSWMEPVNSAPYIPSTPSAGTQQRSTSRTRTKHSKQVGACRRCLYDERFHRDMTGCLLL